MRQIGQYEIRDEDAFRRGGTGSVYAAWCEDRKVALKLYSTPELESGILRSFFEKEVAALQSLQHPNIVQLLDHGYSEPDRAHYVVLEWVDDTIRSFLDRYDSGDSPLRWWDSFAPEVALPLLDALKVCHERGIYHRDIKPSNILVASEGVPQLADFGLARVATDSMTVSDFRTAAYLAPEGHSGAQSDLYSLGVTFVELLAGSSYDLSIESMADRIQQAIFDADLRADAAEFLNRMIASDMGKRFQTAGQALARLQEILSHRQDVDAPQGLTFHIFIPTGVREKIGLSVGAVLSAEQSSAVISDLENLRATRREHTGEDTMYLLFGREHTYLAKPDRYAPTTTLALVDAWPTTDRDFDDAPRAAAFPGSSVYAKTLPRSDKIAAERAFAEFERECARRLAQRHLDEKRDFDEGHLQRWGEILTSKEALERAREKPLRYLSFTNDGPNRMKFTLSSTPDEAAVIGQERKVDGRSRYRGIVEAVEGQDIYLRTTAGHSDRVPSEGKLKVDRWASQSAIRRERNALSDLRNRETVRPDLRDLLVNPAKAVPAGATDVDFFDADLDEPKTEAVRRVTGSPDMFAIEGPPGTGKTRLIAELVRQEISNGRRVLLTAQSHAAVDNAIERLRDEDLTIVRVGHPDRIDPETFERFHIDGALERWTADVRTLSATALDKWADDQGIDASVRAVLTFNNQIDRVEANIENLTNQLDATSALDGTLRRALEDPSWSGVVDLDPEIIQKSGIHFDDLSAIEQPDTGERLEIINAHFETLVEREDELTKQRRNLLQEASQVSGKSFTNGADVRGLAIEVSGTSSAEVSRYERLTSIQQDWATRFGSGTEFQALLLASANVVAGTCLGFASLPAVSEAEFDVTILDEASKASPTEALVPMARARKWVLVGDTRQLPPFVDSELLEHSAVQRRDELEETIFGHLLMDLPDENRIRLTMQHRMVPAIGNLVSDCFYEGTLQSSRMESSIASVHEMFDPPVMWLSTTHVPRHGERRLGTSFANDAEARVVRQFIDDLNKEAERFEESVSVAVLSAYGAQRELLRRTVASLDLGNLEVGVFSVDEFQGQERDIAIYSAVRSNRQGKIGFLSSIERLNVALSRGRDALLIVGDEKHMRFASASRNPFSDVLAYIDGHDDTHISDLIEEP